MAELPTPGADHVDVHEIRCRIIAHTASVQRQGSISRLKSIRSFVHFLRDGAA
jgi:hypothetical protein